MTEANKTAAKALHDTLIAADPATLVHDAATHGATHHDVATHLNAIQAKVTELSDAHLATLDDAGKATFTANMAKAAELENTVSHKLSGIESANTFVSHANVDAIANDLVEAGKTGAVTADHLNAAALKSLDGVKFEAETAKTAGATISENLGKIYGDLKTVATEVTHTAGSAKLGALGVGVVAASVLARGKEKDADGQVKLDENGKSNKKWGFLTVTGAGIGTVLIGSAVAQAMGHGNFMKLNKVSEMVGRVGAMR